jgi:hypothetical protein
MLGHRRELRTHKIRAAECREKNHEDAVQILRLFNSLIYGLIIFSIRDNPPQGLSLHWGQLSMKKFLSAAIACAFIAAPAMGTIITGGNEVKIRGAQITNRTDFSYLDANNPINGTGNIRKWSIFTGPNYGPAALLIYRKVGNGLTSDPATTYTLVGQSALKTPEACPATGPIPGFCKQTYKLPSGLAVQAGDFVGLYSLLTGGTMVGGPGVSRVTAGGAGISTVFRPVITSFTASLSVTSVPEPASWMLLIAGFGMVGSAMRRRNAAVAA